MSHLDTRAKLAILADAAKYDASCASSGTVKRTSAGGKGHRVNRRQRHLPQLRPRWPVYLAPQDPVDQQLHIRLPLLHQPAVVERAAGAFYRR